MEERSEERQPLEDTSDRGSPSERANEPAPAVISFREEQMGYPLETFAATAIQLAPLSQHAVLQVAVFPFMQALHTSTH